MTHCITCSKRATFNYNGYNNAIYCGEHKLENMIDVKNKKCVFENCNKQPNYNVIGEKAIYCGEHKLDNMIDVNNKKCLFENCNKRPNYNVIGEKAIYCGKHKLNNMVNVNSKTCEFECCYKIPHYNFENEITAIYCADHKLENMINIKCYKCRFDGCLSSASFSNSILDNPIFCVKHKTNKMINVRKTTCEDSNCNLSPNYNYEGFAKRRFCRLHKLDGMIDVSHIKCITPLCLTRASNKYNGYCLPCCIQVHPEIEVSRNYKTKEKDVVDRITQTFTSFTWVADKKVQDGCSRRRPDLLLDMGSHIIIVEIDENKHTDYDCSCENKRLMELSQDLQHRPIVFIRFNPDDYTNQDGILVKSCWKLNKLGVIQITKTKQKEWEERIETLKQQIQYWIDNPTEKTIEIIELFY